MDISLKDLEAAFANLPVEVNTGTDVFTRSGMQIHSFRYPVSNPEGTARRFFDHLRAHRDTERRDPWADDDRDDEIVDAHVCCEHAGTGDLELLAMAALMPALPMVSKLDPDARERVMDWARRRATDGLPPF